MGTRINVGAQLQGLLGLCRMEHHSPPGRAQALQRHRSPMSHGVSLVSHCPQPQHAPSLPTDPTQPAGEKSHLPIRALPPKPPVSAPLLFSICVMLSAVPDEPPAAPARPYPTLIRSCRYAAVICLVSTSVQTRLADRCVLQLRSLGQHTYAQQQGCSVPLSEVCYRRNEG